jgi:hypothetical protein
MWTMGMMASAHWVSWALPELLLGAVHAGLMTAAARAFQLQMVTNNLSYCCRKESRSYS